MTVIEGDLTGMHRGVYSHWELHCAHYFKTASFVDVFDQMVFDAVSMKPVGASMRNPEGIVFAHALIRALEHVQPSDELRDEIENELRDTDPEARYSALRKTETGTHVGTILDDKVVLHWYPPNLEVHRQH